MTPTPLSIDLTLSHYLMQVGSEYLHAVEEHAVNDRLYWTLWNELSQQLQVWIARDEITPADVDDLLLLINQLEMEQHEPVSTVTGIDSIPTKGEMYDITYIGVIITASTPSPDVLTQIDSLGNVLIHQLIF